MDDLEKLEQVGVLVNKPFERYVKAGLICYSGDNLESHIIGRDWKCFIWLISL